MDASICDKTGNTEELGELDIPSGRVCVCDAGTLAGPVIVGLPKGKYIVRIQRDDSRENTAAVLIAPGKRPTKFEEVGHYPVDAGMSGFFDHDPLVRADQHSWDMNIYDDLICNHLDPAEAKGHAGAFVPFGNSAFSACKSGAGDGVYPVFVGRDAAASVVAVVTIF